MDNSNNNSNNQPWPAQPAGGPPFQNPPDPAGNTPVPPAPTPSWPTPIQSGPTTPVQSDQNISPVTPYQPSVQPQPEPVNQPIADTNFSWPPATQPSPISSTPPSPSINPLSYPQIPPQPEPVNQPIADTNFSWPPATQPSTTFPVSSPPLPEQTLPTYTDPNVTAADTVSAPSSLDNPYGAPVQPPPLDGGLQNPQIPSSTEPAWSPTQTPTEQAPTDLSHLISGNESNNQTITQPETVVMQQTNTPEVPTIQSESKSGIPKWIIGLGAGLLILVAGASAYFILGIGKQPTNTSLPATEAPKVNQQISTPTPSANQPAATGSANFGELQGTQAPPQASSAADIIKARQQQGQ